jgi:predicted negative regulator of RcsB-dependent stress response
MQTLRWFAATACWFILAYVVARAFYLTWTVWNTRKIRANHLKRIGRHRRPGKA